MSSNASATRPLYSGELARLAGVSTDTLRHYERRHLLPDAPRSASGYRLFPPEALHRVRLIRGALSIGFSVKELSAIFGERDRGGAPCHQVRKLAAEKLATLEAQLRDMRFWQRELKKHWLAGTACSARLPAASAPDCLRRSLQLTRLTRRERIAPPH